MAGLCLPDPWGFESLLQGGGMALYKRFYAEVLKLNIEPLMVQPMGPDPLGWFKTPIASLEDSTRGSASPLRSAAGKPLKRSTGSGP